MFYEFSHSLLIKARLRSPKCGEDRIKLRNYTIVDWFGYNLAPRERMNALNLQDLQA